MDYQLAFQTVILLTQVFLILFILAYVVLEFSSAISEGFDVPYVSTEFSLLPHISETLQIRPGDIVYDIGCGDGRLLFFCARRYPQARFVGIERNRLLIWYARVKNTLFRVTNVEIKYGDIFATDFSKATRVYIYLNKPVMMRLAHEQRLPHVRIVSRAFAIPGAAPFETIRLTKRDGFFGQHLAYVYDLAKK